VRLSPCQGPNAHDWEGILPCFRHPGTLASIRFSSIQGLPGVTRQLSLCPSPPPSGQLCPREEEVCLLPFNKVSGLSLIGLVWVTCLSLYQSPQLGAWTTLTMPPVKLCVCVCVSVCLSRAQGTHSPQSTRPVSPEYSETQSRRGFPRITDQSPSLDSSIAKFLRPRGQWPPCVDRVLTVTC
jgi:hypothetical protein